MSCGGGLSTRPLHVAFVIASIVSLALVAGWFGYVGLGLMLCAMAAVWFESAALFGRFERRTLLLPRPRWALHQFGTPPAR